MRVARQLTSALVILPLFLSGCKEESAPPQHSSTITAGNNDHRVADPDDEAQIRKALSQLPPEDRKLALAQKFCAVEGENRLGAMGKPVKIVLEGESVFLCCKGCSKDAQKHPAQTLARVHELRKKYGSPPIGM